jgi:hypothetical protein
MRRVKVEREREREREMEGDGSLERELQNVVLTVIGAK